MQLHRHRHRGQVRGQVQEGQGQGCGGQVELRTEVKRGVTLGQKQAVIW